MIISFVGSGNVATHLARAFYAAGHEIAGIYSRSQAMAEMLARQVGAEAVTDVRHLPASDVYIFAVKDSVLPSLANQFAEIGGAACFPQGIRRKYMNHFLHRFTSAS